ncbi:hypothetical protein [Streptomyces sp. NPDC058739]|uniref:hypothetical protein n=1 Tax=Streptomyces sp. NPDC058739 TaxID=3346618 RepID=UPI0036A664C8
MDKPEPAIGSDLPDLNDTSLEELRGRFSDRREKAKARLLESVGRPARSASPGPGGGTYHGSV